MPWKVGELMLGNGSPDQGAPPMSEEIMAHQAANDSVMVRNVRVLQNINSNARIPNSRWDGQVRT
jgi:hypothetical protein